LEFLENLEFLPFQKFNYFTKIFAKLMAYENAKTFQFLPFLVIFGLNLGLNNLKFGQEAIFGTRRSLGAPSALCCERDTSGLA